MTEPNNLPDRVARVEADLSAALDMIGRQTHLIEQMTKVAQMALERVEVLKDWRDTGAIHERCGVCEESVPLWRNRRLTQHVNPNTRATCPNSGADMS